MMQLPLLSFQTHLYVFLRKFRALALFMFLKFKCYFMNISDVACLYILCVLLNYVRILNTFNSSNVLMFLFTSPWGP